ncbi:UNVERIFIED_CONTAM: hypothetical protein PYX00_002093 [Menopon gallinae]|uniref:DUF3719 domain-containing protein n=1 Tax=Menopon gallinae TaxID=328185 RepID=A0AAW2IGK4_9NEOP
MDIENPSNHIKDEWEAIERTLYQENGMHVTDPELLKECRLWRETFPHIRVRGTAVKTEDNESTPIQKTKSVQAINPNQIELGQLSEKREKIKKKVVSQIVDKLISKLNLSKENVSENEKVVEVDREDRKSNLKSSRIELEKESYFERGKGRDVNGNRCKFGEVDKILEEKSEDDSDSSDDFERNFFKNPPKTERKSALRSGIYNGVTAPETKSNLAKNEEILRSGRLTFQITEKSSSTRLRTDRTDSLASIFKPFELTKKIDKKYESILERILENKGCVPGGPEPRRALKNLSSSETLNRHQRGQFPEENNMKKYKQLPKLNNFTNNWMSRAEKNQSDSSRLAKVLGRNSILNEESEFIKSARNSERQLNSQSCRSEDNFYQYDDKFMEELQREMFGFGTSGRKDYIEEISLKRPEMNYRSNHNYTAKTPKSSSCGDLPKKNARNKKTLKNDARMKKNEIPGKAVPKKKTGKPTGSQNLQLPPIETSIICKEIIGRPKVVTRTLPKKYL